MDLTSILAAIRQEHEQITQAIVSLERMAAGQGKRRGRPPAWMVMARTDTTKKRLGRPPGSKNPPKK
jgi:hypothetical protein